ncbi:MAG: gliding motility-associated-like protein [Glaciecola sp.]|jgi:gliding motility-associated-like protein
MWLWGSLIQDNNMNSIVKYSLFILAILLLSSTACNRNIDDNTAEFADDPNFLPITVVHKVPITAVNNVPCLFENNFLKVYVDSLPFSTTAWYIIKDGNRLIMSNSASQNLTVESKYELEFKYNDGTIIKDTTIAFNVRYCPVEIILSDAFSPNEDGEYDKWTVISSGVLRFSSVIKNDKGATLFSTADINEGWDGTYGGKKMPSGSYHYVVEGVFKNGKLFEYNGQLELIR